MLFSLPCYLSSLPLLLSLPLLPPSPPTSLPPLPPLPPSSIFVPFAVKTSTSSRRAPTHSPHSHTPSYLPPPPPSLPPPSFLIHCSQDKYKQSARTSAGADKWLEVKVWNSSSTEALSAVKEAGYQLIVTHLSKSSITIQVIIIC